MKMAPAKVAKILDRENRRLIERLAGWRLACFFILLSTYIVFVAIFGVLFPVAHQATTNLLLTAITAQLAVVSLAIGAFRFPIWTKVISVVATVLLATYSVVSMVALGWSSPIVTSQFFIFLTQSSLLCAASTLRGGRLKMGSQIQVRDLLIGTTLIAISMPVLQVLLPNLAQVWSTRFSQLAVSGMQGLANSIWCIAILAFFVKGIIPWSFRKEFDRANSLLHIFALLGLALVTELLNVYLVASEPIQFWNRLLFLAVLGISFLPVVALNAQPNQKRWVTTTEFYRQKQLRRRKGELIIR